MSAPEKTIIVIGATGKQGGAVITSLLASPQASTLRIIGVTRDATSPRSRRLAALPAVSVMEGDLSDPGAMLAKAGPAWGLYIVQTNSDAEERQGKALVDAALAHGVQHLVYSSGDRGGPERSETDPTTVKNFAAKYAVEKHLVARAALSPQRATHTILRPVTFFENLTADVHGKGFARMWEQLGDRRLQFVSTEDIGWFAAASLLDPETYAGRAITLVGDELTQPEADVIFKQVTGRHMPIAPCLVASTVKLVLRDSVGDMFRWFAGAGYGSSVEVCREMYPGIKDFRAWIEQNKGTWEK